MYVYIKDIKNFIQITFFLIFLANLYFLTVFTFKNLFIFNIQIKIF